jgi:PKD repeat protein
MPGAQVTFDASGSTDPDGTIKKYEWDLDGNGSYETTTTTPTTTKTYTANATVPVHLRVTDSGGATDTLTHNLVVQTPPTAAFSFTPAKPKTGQSVSFDASGSHAAGTATIVKYEWDLDGNGTYETTTSTPSTSKSYTTAGDYMVALRVTDSTGVTATVKHEVDVSSVTSTVTAALTATPNPGVTGQTISFSAAGSTDSGGTINDYKWDLDGDGTYETDTGATPTASKSYSSAGQVGVSVKVIDNNGSRDVATKTVTVNSPPNATFTAQPNPAVLGGTVSFNASGSSAPSGTITDYSWDLDGNGTYETDTGTTATTTHAYGTPGAVNVGLRVTDSNGNTNTFTRKVNVGSTYSSTVLGTPGLVSYWRMGEASGTSLQDSKGTNDATLHGATLGVPGALGGDSNSATRFNGTSTDWASAPLDLSQTPQVTVEFWLNWNQYVNDDELALEFTSNFNNARGGFLIDPNASEGSFAVGLGNGAGRNNVFIQRPSAGAWHMYTFVMDTTAAGATQIIPYVDGQPVSYTKAASGTTAGNFAASTLYFMSRGGNSLFGAGSLDDLAVYSTTLSAAQVADHYSRGING